MDRINREHPVSYRLERPHTSLQQCEAEEGAWASVEIAAASESSRIGDRGGYLGQNRELTTCCAGSP